MTTGLLVIMCMRAGYIHVGVHVLKSLIKRTRYRNAFNGGIWKICGQKMMIKACCLTLGRIPGSVLIKNPQL